MNSFGVLVQLGADVYNALDLMDNAAVFKDLKFSPAQARLHYYLFNWRCPDLKSSEVGLVLL